jgi:hypothetical protein
MALLTLAEYKEFMTEATALGVIDEFIKSGWLWQNLPFVAGATLTKGNNPAWVFNYSRVITPSAAQTRSINEEYTASQAKVQKYNTECKILGGKFQVDRAMRKGGDIADLVQFQLEQKIKSARALFNQLFILGDEAADAEQFDGLNVALAGSSTEFNTGSYIDFSSATKIKDNWRDFRLALNQFIQKLDGRPTALLVDDDFLPIMTQVAGEMGLYTQKADEFGNVVEYIGPTPLIPMGDKSGSSQRVIGTQTRTIGGGPITGLTDLYAVRLAEDGVHAVSPEAQSATLEVYLPDFTAPGVVKDGEVEMIAGLAMKSTRSAGVFRNIKIQ